MIRATAEEMAKTLPEEGIPVLPVDRWETPATSYIPARKDGVKITRIRLRKGLYLMEGVRGYAYYSVIKPIPVTQLIIGRETVMVDDPLQWYGMRDLAVHCKGKVLIAGLGLGLILHALQENKEVKSIHVIEKNLDVIDLMMPNIPADKRIKVTHADFYDFVERIGMCHFEKVYTELKEHRLGLEKERMEKQIEQMRQQKTEGDYDTVVMDIWWGRGDNIQTRFQMDVLKIKINAFMPDSKLMIWGKRDPVLNPAVTKDFTDMYEL